MSRTLVIVESHHHGNTRRVAEAIAAVLGADIVAPATAWEVDLATFDLVGFGSGVYFGRLGTELLRLIADAPSLPPRVFLFSTAGLPWGAVMWHAGVRRALRRRGCRIVGEFCCRGWDSFGPLKLIGGLNRRHPDAADLHRAREFARSLVAPAAGAGSPA